VLGLPVFLRASLHCVPASQNRASTQHAKTARVGSPGLPGAAAREPAAQGVVVAADCTARLRSPRLRFGKLRVISG